MFENLHKEIKYLTSKSGGAGGQHVNKVATKVELQFHVMNSELLTDQQKEIILQKMANRISSSGILSLQCEATRSQLKNKEIALKRLKQLLKESLTIEKKRKPTRPNKSAIKKRLDNKKRQSQKKSDRKFDKNL